MNTPEKKPRPRLPMFKLVDKNEILALTQDGFETKRKIIRPFGEVQLSGIKTSQASKRHYEATGVTMKNGILLRKDAQKVENEDKLHTLFIDIYPVAREVAGYQWICTVFIGETGLAYETSFDPYPEDTREHSLSETSHTWHSTNEDDTNLYEIMASSEDTEFLSQLSFSISLRKDSL